MLALILFVVLVASCSGACPVWTTHNATSGKCECGNNLGGLVKCDPHTLEVSVLFCYCMTYNEQQNTTAVGYCLYQCKRRGSGIIKCRSFNSLETNTTDKLNRYTCNDFNRTGQLCAKCNPGYGLPVFSYTLGCVNCTDTSWQYGALKYFAVAYLPLTVFYILVILFKISVTSGSMVSYVLTCQIVSIPSLLRAIVMEGQNKFVLSFFTFWNLDIARSYPPFCIHEKVSALQVLALDYLVGFYPLFLILLTYFAVVLHDRYSIVVRMWRPAYQVFMWLRREWDIRGSLVQAFATFFLLSYVKILNVSFDLLTPVILKTADGKGLNQTYVFNDAEVPYLGSEHLPYFVMAIVVTTVFNILPALLLLLYPCSCFQKCLNFCHLNSFALRCFMDAFQGCYRHKPRDCRYFTALYLFLRVLFLVTVMLVKDPMYFALFGFYFIIAAVILTITKPYKLKRHNTTDILFFLLYASTAFGGSVYTSVAPSEPQLSIGPAFIIVFTPLLLVPITYGLIMLLKNVVPQRLIQFLKGCFKSVLVKFKRDKGQDEEESSLPYRFNSEQSPLLFN